MDNFLKGLSGALGLLTIVPAGDASQWEDRTKLLYFPLVGLLIGILLCLVNGFTGLFFNSLAQGLLVLVVLTAVTGGLHLDGLSDTADGLFAFRGRERALEIMKDPRSGVYGTLTLCVALLAKWVGIISVAGSDRYYYLLFVPVLSRAVMLYLLHYSKPARNEEGMGAVFMGPHNGRLTNQVLLIALVLPVLTVYKAGTGLLLVAITCLAAAGWRWFVHKQLGGMTGDTVGAGCELVEALLFLSGALL